MLRCNTTSYVMLYFILYSTTLYTSLCRAQEVGTLASQEVAFSWSSFAWHLPRHHQGMSTIAWLKSAQSPGSWRMQRFAMVPYGSPWFATVRRSLSNAQQRVAHATLEGPCELKLCLRLHLQWGHRKSA